jgi:hypothetical protein
MLSGQCRASLRRPNPSLFTCSSIFDISRPSDGDAAEPRLTLAIGIKWPAELNKLAKNVAVGSITVQFRSRDGKITELSADREWLELHARPIVRELML